MENTFKATWGTLLKVMTTLALIILLGCIAVGIVIKIDEYYLLWYSCMIGIPSLVLIVTLFFIVSKYEIQDNKLLIHRFFWKKAIDLHGILSVEYDPDAVKGSIRLFGNGGLFAFSGIYKNKKLGNYRVFATDYKKCVVMKNKEKTFVVTPENPKTFVEKISNLIKDRPD